MSITRSGPPNALLGTLAKALNLVKYRESPGFYF